MVTSKYGLARSTSCTGLLGLPCPIDCHKDACTLPGNTCVLALFGTGRTGGSVGLSSSQNLLLYICGTGLGMAGLWGERAARAYGLGLYFLLLAALLLSVYLNQ